MNSFKSVFSTILAVIFLSSIQSFADTFVVTNLNDPGAGSLRQAITTSNLVPGPDEIVVEEGLIGTIVLNLDQFFIQDDLTIEGPGADKITIDAGGKSDIFDVVDNDDGINRVVKISGLRLINGNAFQGGAIANTEILTVDSCLFENNSSIDDGGAIANFSGTIYAIKNSTFTKNSSNGDGGAIANFLGTINEISNSTFENNIADSSGGAIENQESLIENINNSTFNGNIALDEGGAIYNFMGTINEIKNSTFNDNTTPNEGGAIISLGGIIETVVNCTFNNNSAESGGAIWNDAYIGISFTTISGNQSSRAGGGGGILLAPVGRYRIRNSIIAFNSPSNCAGPIGDIGGNYSNDLPTDNFRCGFSGDDSQIILGELADNGGPTETMALLGGDPLNGATVNCDALDEMGNPTGIPIGIDQRYFPRPFLIRCDSGAFETSPSANVTITKVTDPSGGTGFEFESDGFSSLEGCGLSGEGGEFIMDDGDSISCIVPVGDYKITETIPEGDILTIFCLEAPDNVVIDNETGEVRFSIIDSSTNLDCIFTNVSKENGGNGGGCSLTSAGIKTSIPIYLLIPIFFILRRTWKTFKNK